MLMSIKLILVLIANLLVSAVNINAQNLIQNSDFENCKAPAEIFNFNCSDWYSVCGNVDYYNVNAINERNGVPYNEFGYHIAHSKNGYIGLIVFSSDGTQEFVQSKLLKALVKGQTYKVKFFVKFSNKQECYSTWKIGAFFSENKVLCINNIPNYCQAPKLTTTYLDFNYLKNVHFNKYKAQVENKQNDYINSDDWVPIEGIFTAKGGESYITLGGFYIEDNEVDKILESVTLTTNFNTDRLEAYLTSKVLRYEDYIVNFRFYSYYFIDDVFLTPVDENGNEIILYPELLLPDALKEELINIDSIKIGDPVILRNIYFEFDKSRLLSESHFELNKLVDIMLQNLSIEIEISGHTDNTGNEEYNLELSQTRAKAVVEYLIDKGINPNRLKFKGYGWSKPITENETEEGKSKNRRVEFTILKK